MRAFVNGLEPSGRAVKRTMKVRPDANQHVKQIADDRAIDNFFFAASEPLDGKPLNERVLAGGWLDDRRIARRLGKVMLGTHPEIFPGGSRK